MMRSETAEKPRMVSSREGMATMREPLGRTREWRLSPSPRVLNAESCGEGGGFADEFAALAFTAAGDEDEGCRVGRRLPRRRGRR